MKKRFFVIFCFLITSVVFANKKQYCTIYTKSGKVLKVQVNVDYGGVIVSASPIYYFENNNAKKIKLSEIEKIEIGSITYEVLTFRKKIKTGPSRGKDVTYSLAELVENGPVKLYKVYVTDTEGIWINGSYQFNGTYKITEQNYLANKNEIKWITKIGFKKNIKSFFPNCDVIKVVKEKKYKFKDLLEIVKLGNKMCGL